jgi:hypothetical protein
MRARSLAIAALLLAPALAGCATDPAPGTTETVRDGFEDGIQAWTRGADVPGDPNRGGKPVAWNITPSDERAVEGDWSVRFDLDGSQDDGTIWLTQPLRVEEDQAYRATVSAWAWSPSESANVRAHLAMMLGPDPPQVEEDFPAPGNDTTVEDEVDRGGLREALDRQAGWREYRFGWTVPADANRTLHMAVGISAVWETELGFWVDDLTVELTRLPADG